MKPITVKQSCFRLTKLLDALHKFSVDHLGSGNPLPVASGDTVYHDPADLAEALAAEGDEEAEVPDDSLRRLEVGLTLYGQFAAFNGFDGFGCADGQQVEVPCLDDDEEHDESGMPRRRRTKKYLESVENTTADECTAFGFIISLDGDTVEIEARGMNDVSGECELEPMVEPNLLSDAMRRWVKSFSIPKRGGKFMNSESRPLSACGWAILHRIASGNAQALAEVVAYFRDPDEDVAGERWQFLRLAERDAWVAVELLLTRSGIERRFSKGVLDGWVQVTRLGQEIREALKSFFDSYRHVEFPRQPRSFGAFAIQELRAARLAGELDAELRDVAGSAEEIIARLASRLNDRFPVLAEAVRNPALDLPGMGWGILDWRIRMNFETLVALPTCHTPLPNPGLEDLVVLLVNIPSTVRELLGDVVADDEFARRARLAKARIPSHADPAGEMAADAPSILGRVVPIRATTLAEAAAEADRLRRTENTLVALHALWGWYAALPLDQRKEIGEFRSKHELWVTVRFRHRLR